MVPLLVVVTIVAFLVLDLIVHRVRAKQKRGVIRAVPQPTVPEALEWTIQIPEGIFVSPGHAWVALETSGRVKVGMDDFAWQMLGTPDSMELPKLGSAVKAGEPLLTLYRGAHLARLVAPVDGVVQDVNTHLSGRPESGSKDPYQEGWMIALKPKDLARNLPGLAIAESARVFLEREVNRFRSLLADFQPSLAVAADGGRPVRGIVSHLDAEAWDRFRREFMKEQI